MSLGSALYLMAVPIIVFATASVAPPDREFIDKTDKYRINLAGCWRAVPYRDAVGRQKTEFVCGDRNEGLLRITKESLGRRTLAGIVNKELEDLRLYKGKYSLSGKEALRGGALGGVRIAFYYLEANRQVAATYYFLEGANTVWVLRFTGRVGSLDSGRVLTDQLARSFCPL